jgi:hypothetical protein
MLSFNHLIISAAALTLYLPHPASAATVDDTQTSAHNILPVLQP